VTRPNLTLIDCGPSSLEDDFIRIMCTGTVEEAEAALDRLNRRGALTPVSPEQRND
jgi:hypothetical protein